MGKELRVRGQRRNKKVESLRSNSLKMEQERMFTGEPKEREEGGRNIQQISS